MVWDWNVFRILADVSHTASKCILIWAIHSNRSAEGEYRQTQTRSLINPSKTYENHTRRIPHNTSILPIHIPSPLRPATLVLQTVLEIPRRVEPHPQIILHFIVRMAHLHHDARVRAHAREGKGIQDGSVLARGIARAGAVGHDDLRCEGELVVCRGSS